MSFPARYPGRCGGCNDPFESGEEVDYDNDGIRMVAVRCCGDAAEPRPATEDAHEHVVEPDRVMPRGKTAADRCGTCFQIPASNGVCGCF